MYKIAKLTIIINSNNKDNSIDLVEDLLGKLYNNGQIADDYIVEKHEDHYIATVRTTDDSLKYIYFNSYIKKSLEKIEFSYEIIADDAFATDFCHCTNHEAYILGTFYEYHFSPMFCSDCGMEIPLTKIPYQYDHDEHFDILSYQRMYNNVVGLWMNSLSDKFTKRQLTYFNSELTKRWLEICSELERKLNKSVYFLLPLTQFEINKKTENTEKCPKCGEKLKVLESTASIDKVCHSCRLGFIDN